MTTLALQPIRIDRRCGKGWEGEIGECKRAKLKGAATLARSAATWGAGKVVGSAVAGVAQQHGIPPGVAARIAESATQALLNTALGAKGKTPGQLATDFIGEAVGNWAGKDPNTVDDAIAGGDEHVQELVKFALTTSRKDLSTRFRRQGLALQQLFKRPEMRLDAMSVADAVFDLSIVAMALASKQRTDRACGKGWQGQIGQCKRAKVKGAAIHGGEMVAAWAVGKVAGGAIAQLAVAHGVPHEVAKIVAESSIQALTATALHAATHKSSPRKLAGFFVTQAAAAAAGKAAHGEAAAITAGSSPAVQQASTLAAGKLSGLGTVQAIEKHGRVLQGLVSRMKRRTDAAKGERLSEQELRTLMELGLMGVAMLEKRTDGKKKKPCDDQCQCDPCKEKHDALIDAVLALNLDAQQCGKGWEGTKGSCRRARMAPAKPKVKAVTARNLNASPNDAKESQRRSGIIEKLVSRLEQGRFKQSGLSRDDMGKNGALTALRDAKNPKVGLIGAKNARGQYTGFMSYKPGRRDIEIENFGTDQSTKGAGREMFQQLLSVAAKEGKGISAASTKDAIGFYKKMGMTDEGYGAMYMSPAQVKELAAGRKDSISGAVVVFEHQDAKTKVPCNNQRGWSGTKPGCVRSKPGTAARVRGVMRQRQGKPREPVKATVKRSQPKRMSQSGAAKRLTEADADLRAALRKGRAGSSIANPEPTSSRNEAELIRGLTEANESIQSALKGEPIPGQSKPKLEPIRGGGKSLRLAKGKSNNKPGLKVIEGGQNKSLEQLFQEADKVGAKYTDVPQDMASRRKTKKKANNLVDQTTGKLLEKVNQSLEATTNASDLRKPTGANLKASERDLAEAGQLAKKLVRRGKVVPIGAGEKDQPIRTKNKPSGKSSSSANKVTPIRSGRKNLTQEFDNKIAAVRAIEDPDERAKAARELAFEAERLESRWGRDQGLSSIRKKTAKLQRETKKRTKTPQPKRANKPQQGAYAPKPKPTLFKAPNGQYYSIDSQDHADGKKGVPCNNQRGWVGTKPGCKRAKAGTAKRARGVMRKRQGKQFSVQPKKIAKKTAQHRDGNPNGWLIYPKGRRTAIAAPGSMTRSEAISYANKKKKRGGKGIASARRATDAEQKLLDRGVWVRTGPNGEPAGKSNLRGFGPKPKKLDAIVVNPTLDAVVTKMSGGSISVFFTEPPSLMIAQDLNDLDKQFSGLDDINREATQKRMWFLSPPPTYCVDRTSEAIALSLEEAGLRVGRKYRPLSEYERKSKPVSVKSFSAVKAVKDMQKVS